MPRFISTRHFSLDFLGKEWKECFIVFNSLSVAESRDLVNQKLGKKEPGEIIDVSVKLLKDHFIKGTAIEGGKLVKLKAEDFDDLPAQIIERAVLFLVGEVSSRGA